MDEHLKKIKEFIKRADEQENLPYEVYDLFSNYFSSILGFNLEDNAFPFDVKLETVVNEITIDSLSEIIDLYLRNKSLPLIDIENKTHIDWSVVLPPDFHCYLLPTKTKDLKTFKYRDIAELYGMKMIQRPFSKLNTIEQILYYYQVKTDLRNFLYQEIRAMTRLQFGIEYLIHFNTYFDKNKAVEKIIKYAHQLILKYSRVVCCDSTLTTYLEEMGSMPVDKISYCHRLRIYSFQLSEYLRKLHLVQFFILVSAHHASFKKMDDKLFRSQLAKVEEATFPLFKSRMAEQMIFRYTFHKAFFKSNSSFSYLFTRLKTEGLLKEGTTNETIIEWIYSVFDYKISRLISYDLIKNPNWELIYNESLRLVTGDYEFFIKVDYGFWELEP